MFPKGWVSSPPGTNHPSSLQLTWQLDQAAAPPLHPQPLVSPPPPAGWFGALLSPVLWGPWGSGRLRRHGCRVRAWGHGTQLGRHLLGLAAWGKLRRQGHAGYTVVLFPQSPRLPPGARWELLRGRRQRPFQNRPGKDCWECWEGACGLPERLCVCVGGHICQDRAGTEGGGCGRALISPNSPLILPNGAL